MGPHLRFPADHIGQSHPRRHQLVDRISYSMAYVSSQPLESLPGRLRLRLTPLSFPRPLISFQFEEGLLWLVVSSLVWR